MSDDSEADEDISPERPRAETEPILDGPIIVNTGEDKEAAPSEDRRYRSDGD